MSCHRGHLHGAITYRIRSTVLVLGGEILALESQYCQFLGSSNPQNANPRQDGHTLNTTILSMRPLAGPPAGLASRLPCMFDFWDAAGAQVLLATELLLLLVFGVAVPEPEPPPPVYDFRREGMMRTIAIDLSILGPS